MDFDENKNGTLAPTFLFSVYWNVFVQLYELSSF